MLQLPSGLCRTRFYQSGPGPGPGNYPFDLREKIGIGNSISPVSLLIIGSGMDFN